MIDFLNHTTGKPAGIMSYFINPINRQKHPVFRATKLLNKPKYAVLGFTLPNVTRQFTNTKAGFVKERAPRCKAIAALQTPDAKKSASSLDLVRQVTERGIRSRTTLKSLKESLVALPIYEKKEFSTPLDLIQLVTQQGGRVLKSMEESIEPTRISVAPTVSKPVHLSGQRKLLEWLFTSSNAYEFVLIVLHNLAHICLQKEEDKNFINSSLLPRFRFMRFTTSAAIGVIYHVAIGVLFTPFVIGTLGQKEPINHIWYGYWVGASISMAGVLTGIFGTITGNFLIKKALQEGIPQCKNVLNPCLLRMQNMRTEINKANISCLVENLNSADTVDKMVVVLQEVVSIPRKAI